MQSEGFKSFLNHPTYLIVTVVLYFVTLCSLVCCRLDRKVPVNYLLLFIFTLCVSFMVGGICAMYDQNTVISAAFLTTAVCGGIIIYAMTTKTDFTVCGPILFICLLVFVTMGLLMAIMGFHKGIVWSTLGALLFSAYLLIDVQMIMGGSRKQYEISEDDYILAALLIYMDIIQIFIYILEIYGNR